ncbi:MAG TPA: hypothetical protein VFR31_02075 [Thermoanaerobaculia bacterium]|nr:hypothetical protein [Thermoanaerobaculia bacterium]
MNQNTGQVEVSFSYSRHLGPRYIHGGVTLQLDALQPYSFSSLAEWPRESYESQIREAVEEVLREHQGHLRSTRVVLKRIEWDDTASCAAGFRQAALAACRAAFNV